MKLRVLGLSFALMMGVASSAIAADRVPVPDYAREVAPLFRKYCLGCHNAQEAQGSLVLESHALTMHGGEHGAIVVAGNPEKSRLILVLEKRIEPSMPPEGNKGPSPAELAVLKAWIAGGAKDSKTTSAAAEIVTPKIEPTGKVRDPIAAVAYSPDGRLIAAARYGCVEIYRGPPQSGRTAKGLAALSRVKKLSGISGNVNAVGFYLDGGLLFAAAGEPGLFGELTLWNTGTWTRIKTLRGHRDALLGAALRPDGKMVATASYDQTVRLWDVATGRELRVLKGHNGPVFDVAFDPTGRLLATASGDRTVKLWDVASGERLDTFSQPTKDQYAVVFSPDGQHVIAGGGDSRIRVWRISPSAKEGTNELVASLFAHDGPIMRLAVSRDGRWLASSSEDRTIKIWDAARLVQVIKLADQSDWTTALAIAPDNHTLAAGRMDGSLSLLTFGDATATAASVKPLDYAKPPAPMAGPEEKLHVQNELEPNDSPAHPMDVTLPARVNGVLSRGTGEGTGEHADVDYYRFRAKAGQTWILETEAARKNSPADTRIDVLHADGSPVVRCLLRAVRDSSITFRPIDSRQAGARLENWQEMDVNQFLYLSGEVTRLFQAPRGPDSEYGFYGEDRGRRCYFDTSAVSHALNEPVYIVEPYAPGTRLADNGLPVFPLYYSNDDDGTRKLGHDSRLTFTAPADGTYLARVADVRGYGGPNFKYAITIREPKPDFAVSFRPDKLSVAAGGGQRFVVAIDREDDFEGPVRIDFAGVPAGFHVTSPLVVQKGINAAAGSLNAELAAKPASPGKWKSLRVTATAMIGGRDVVKAVPGFREVNLGPAPKVIVHLKADQPASEGAGDATGMPAASMPAEIVIQPGQTTTAMLEIERHGYDGELRFEVDNLPHGVIVDNIGLNGIMVRAGEKRRQVFLTAAKWVPPTERLIYAVADREGNQTSLPIQLRVEPKSP